MASFGHFFFDKTNGRKKQQQQRGNRKTQDKEEPASVLIRQCSGGATYSSGINDSRNREDDSGVRQYLLPINNK